MGSYVMEKFLGNGSLKQLLPKLLEEGWDDVPALKMMSPQDMDALSMTQQQKTALEIRSYLHDRALMQYADKLEDSGKSLQELLEINVSELSSQYSLRRGHLARFTDRTVTGGISRQSSYTLPARQRSTANSTSENASSSKLSSVMSKKMTTATRSVTRTRLNYEESIERSIADLSMKRSTDPEDNSYVKPLSSVENIAPYSAVENIAVQKLTPQYKVGLENLDIAKTGTIKASELWRDKPAVLLCVRRPGCIMCRAEAHQLYAKKPIFHALGIQLIAVLHEQIDPEVKDFWPHYWGGMVILDRDRGFFKALGGGKLVRSKFITGFLFNAKAILNYKRAKSMGVEQSFKGEGEIKGGLYVIGSGKKGILCQFAEKNFGDWAPLGEIVQVCAQLQRAI